MTEVLTCRSLSVAYGAADALSSVDLTVERGETVALLGPSGSGKTTLLHAIAGFLEVRDGSIILDGAIVSTPDRTTPPEKRSIGVVFQSYALWPHLDALDNVAYPLRRGGEPRGKAREEAARLLDLVGLSGFHHRKPDQLSGGQQQRIGLARALARRADLYLFDEPTAHLDSSIRTSVQEEIDRRRAETGAAALYATHDASEALALADRVVVLRAGEVTQVGTPAEVYEKPADAWTGSLTGPVATLAAVAAEPGWVLIDEVRVHADSRAQWPTGELLAIVRADWVQPGDGVRGVITAVRFRGTHTDYEVETAAGTLACRVPGSPDFEPGHTTDWTIEKVWVP